MTDRNRKEPLPELLYLFILFFLIWRLKDKTNFFIFPSSSTEGSRLPYLL